MRFRIAARAVLACVALLLTAAPQVLAHVDVDVATPRDGSRVTSPPRMVVLEFTGDVEDTILEATLIAPDGREDEDRWSARGERVEIDMPARPADGRWQVRWRVTGGDGHPITGTTSFTLGATGAAERTPGHAGHLHASSTYPHDELELAALVGRILYFAGLLAFIGGIAFAVIVAPGWRMRGMRPAVAAVVFGAWLVLGTHVAMLEERSALELLDPRAWVDGLGDIATRGYALSALLVFAAMRMRARLEPAAWQARDGRVPMALCVVVVAAPLALATSGHAGDGSALWLRIPLDALHVLAGAAWLGGLAQLLTITAGRRGLDARMRDVVDRYSRVAMVSVALLVASGVYATFDELGAGLGEFVGSTWGRLVLLKVLLLVAALPLANANRLRNVPGVSADPRRNVPRLRRFVALELGIVGWVVIATAMLVYATPPT